MNRRDFVLVARSLRAVRPTERAGVPAYADEAYDMWSATVDRIASDLSESCSGFDVDRFKREAGR